MGLAALHQNLKIIGSRPMNRYISPSKHASEISSEVPSDYNIYRLHRYFAADRRMQSRMLHDTIVATVIEQYEAERAIRWFPTCSQRQPSVPVAALETRTILGPMIHWAPDSIPVFSNASARVHDRTVRRLFSPDSHPPRNAVISARSESPNGVTVATMSWWSCWE